MSVKSFVDKELAQKKKNNPKEYARVGRSKPTPISNKGKKKKK